jgi:hypothetical protein
MGAKYTITFDSNTGEACVLTISDTSFAGAVTALKGAGRSPVNITHENEGVFAPIMATSCEVNYINEGSVSIEDFVTDDPVRFTAEFTVNGNTKFKGVLSLDDLSERVIFAPNDAKLIFTDGIGLLKNFDISDTDLSPLEGRYRLTDILDTILEKTGLNLPLRTFANVYDSQMANRTASNTNDPFYQTGINIKTFLQNSSDEDKWESCYEALEKILKAFHCKLFQEGGKWVVVRVPEIVSNPAGTQYTTGGAVDVAVSNAFSVVNDLVPVNRSQVKFLKRAARKLSATFNYRYPQLLKNANLQNLGALVTSTVVGPNTIFKYEAADFTERGSQQAEIWVVRNTATGREVDRYLYLYFNGSTSGGVLCTAIEVDQGDLFAFSLRIAADSDSNFSGITGVNCLLVGYAGTNYYPNINPQTNLAWQWFTTTETTTTALSNRISWEIAGRDDLSQYFNYNLGVAFDIPLDVSIPADGLLYIILNGWNNVAGRRADKDAKIRDLQFEYIKTVSDSLIIKGHEHIGSQNVSNREETEEIYLDDSPATSIKGTLFWMDGTSVPKRTASWSDDETNFYRFGEIRAIRQMDIEGATRYNVQGAFQGIVSLYNTLEFAFFTGRTFYPTRVTIDYGQGITDGEFAEIDGPSSVGAITYEFRRIYE